MATLSLLDIPERKKILLFKNTAFLALVEQPFCKRGLSKIKPTRHFYCTESHLPIYLAALCIFVWLDFPASHKKIGLIGKFSLGK
jgi:hypothetical protein